MVSVLGLGTAPLGGLYQASSDAAAQATVDRARALGVNYFDTAPQYGQGLAEGRLGRALRHVAIADVVVSTKVGRVLEPAARPVQIDLWPEALQFDARYDTTTAGIRRSVTDSLERTGRSSVDILLLHDPDAYAAGPDELKNTIAEAYMALSTLRADGMVKAIGLGVNSPEPCQMALDLGQWDCMMLAGTYSVLQQNDGGLLDRCHSLAVSVLVAGPFMSGALAGGSYWKYGSIPASIAARIARLHEICDRHGVPIEALALQFPLAHPAVAAVVTGMRSPDEVSQNVAHLNRLIPADCWTEISADGFIPAQSLGGDH